MDCYYTFKHIDGTIYEVKSNISRMMDYVGKKNKIFYDTNFPKNRYFFPSDELGNFFGTIFGITLIVIGVVIIEG
ncbi:hypothetical protein BWK58_07835 [Flavobacterium columnare]|nr:hypothetical protein BWK58_07835 [Flavobacterium columnare]